MSHPGRVVVAEPITTRGTVRAATELGGVGFERSGATGAQPARNAELLLADVDATRSLVGERSVGQTRPLLK